MKRTLLELKRYIFSPLFAITVAAALALIIYPLLDSLRYIFNNPATRLYYINGIHTFGTFDLFAPVIAATPCSAAFYNDYGTGYCKFILTRTKKIKYLISKACTCGITGGLALLVPNLLFFIFLWIFGAPHTADIAMLQDSIFANIEYANNGSNVMIILLLLAFLFGASWALVGLAVSAFIPNKFAAAVAPFMIYFALSTMLSITDETFILSPINMLYPNAHLMPSLAFCFVYSGVLIIIAATIFIIRAYGRLENAL